MNNIKLENFENLIEDHARVAFKKIRKPSPFTINDLVQEGVKTFLYARNYYTKNKNTSFKTFLTTCLRNHFSTLITCSFAKISLSRFTISESEMKSFRVQNPSDITNLLIITNKLNNKEKNYIKRMLGPEGAIMKRTREIERAIINKVKTLNENISQSKEKKMFFETAEKWREERKRQGFQFATIKTINSIFDIAAIISERERILIIQYPVASRDTKGKLTGVKIKQEIISKKQILEIQLYKDKEM